MFKHNDLQMFTLKFNKYDLFSHTLSSVSRSKLLMDKKLFMCVCLICDETIEKLMYLIG